MLFGGAVEELLEAGVVPEGRECGVGVDCGEITIAEVEEFLQSGKSFLLVAVPCVEGTQPVKIIRGLHCPSLQHGGHGLAVAVLCSERLFLPRFATSEFPLISSQRSKAAMASGKRPCI